MPENLVPIPMKCWNILWQASQTTLQFHGNYTTANMHYIPVCTRVCEWAHHVGFRGFRKDWCTHRAYTTELNIVACNAHNFLVIWVRCKKVANSTQCNFIHCMHSAHIFVIVCNFVFSSGSILFVQYFFIAHLELFIAAWPRGKQLSSTFGCVS